MSPYDGIDFSAYYEARKRACEDEKKEVLHSLQILADAHKVPTNYNKERFMLNRLLLFLRISPASAFRDLEERYQFLKDRYAFDLEQAKQSLATYEHVVATRAKIIAELELRVSEQAEEIRVLQARLGVHGEEHARS